MRTKAAQAAGSHGVEALALGSAAALPGCVRGNRGGMPGKEGRRMARKSEGDGQGSEGGNSFQHSAVMWHLCLVWHLLWLLLGVHPRQSLGSEREEC
mmetsp:Transcript_28413/g.80186  ORF Transcript_28413/g.80186 Transcript_28413/m.80186 type:complete len:97 (-) Transcript_28413:1024-1314(-)